MALSIKTITAHPTQFDTGLQIGLYHCQRQFGLGFKVTGISREAGLVTTRRLIRPRLRQKETTIDQCAMGLPH